MREQKTVLTYKCDRCDEKCVRTHYERPEQHIVADDDRGWLFMLEGMHIGMGPPSKDETRKNERTDKRVEFILCPTCAEKFDAFMRLRG